MRAPDEFNVFRFGGSIHERCARAVKLLSKLPLPAKNGLQVPRHAVGNLAIAVFAKIKSFQYA